MRESEALEKMVSPGMRRKGVWRNGVLQIWVTRACDRACYHCTQNSQLSGKADRITLDQFEQAVKSLVDYFGVVGMFGGNPPMHPQFDDLCRIFQQYVPFERRGLWSNNPLGKGRIMRETFNPAVSNLNVHQDQKSFDEFIRDWPECQNYVFGLKDDSRHGPPLISMSDLDKLPSVGGSLVENTEENRLELISRCDINQRWSAMIGVFRGELRGWFCEIAGAHAMLHQHNPNWAGTGQPLPDTGVLVEPGWWQKSMSDFVEQVRVHCHSCGVPLKGFGSLANNGPTEQVSLTHLPMVQLSGFKGTSRPVQVIHEINQLGEKYLPRLTDYIQNSHLSGDAK